MLLEAGLYVLLLVLGQGRHGGGVCALWSEWCTGSEKKAAARDPRGRSSDTVASLEYGIRRASPRKPGQSQQSTLSPTQPKRAHPPLAMSKRKLEPQTDAEDLATLHAIYKEMSSAADAGNLPLLKFNHDKATGMRPLHASRKTLFLERQLCKRAAAARACPSQRTAPR